MPLPIQPSRTPSPQALVAGLWIIVGCANVALLALAPSSRGELIKVVGTSACGLALSLLLSFATTRLIEWRRRVRWAILAGLALSAGAGLWVFDAAFQAQDLGSGALHWPPSSAFVNVRLNLVYYDLLFFLQTSALALLALQRIVQARERQLGEARVAAQQARLAALRFQLNPHFLFNTLNAISTLVGEARNADAEEMIARLSGFLRVSLESDGVDLTTLAAELETAQAYLDIEAVRFGERLEVRYACDDGLSDALTPSLILQPLIENAVKYAVAPAKAPVVVAITATVQGDSLVLKVEDTGALASRAVAPGAGVGLRNVTARLEALYGDAASLQAGPTSGGFTAVVRLPHQRAIPEPSR